MQELKKTRQRSFIGGSARDVHRNRTRMAFSLKTTIALKKKRL